MGKAWFGAKQYGYGIAPASLAGWVATGVFVLAMIFTRPVVAALHGPPWLAYVVFLALIAGFFLLIARKGDGRAFQWRWGGRG